MSDKIGDSQVVAVAPVLAAFPQSVVAIADLGDATAAINDTHVSRKVAGATVILESAGVYTIAVAQGSEPTDTWIDSAAVTVTPA